MRYISTASEERKPSTSTHIGTRVPLHSTALGKAILAHLPSEQFRTIVDQRGLPSFTERTTTDIDTLLEELEAINNRGYAIDDEEHHEGLRCIAVPILSNGDRVSGPHTVCKTSDSPRRSHGSSRSERTSSNSTSPTLDLTP